MVSSDPNQGNTAQYAIRKLRNDAPAIYERRGGDLQIGKNCRFESVGTAHEIQDIAGPIVGGVGFKYATVAYLGIDEVP
jgi:hypothetical protein